MFGDVQHTIRDAQYREALSKIHASPPEKLFPKPSDFDLETYKDDITTTLENVVDSPIGNHYFKEYLHNFLNIAIIIDFLMQYEKVKKLDEDVTEIELRDLVGLADLLPAPYKADVRRINQQLKIMDEGEEYHGEEATDFVLNNEADSFLMERVFKESNKSEKPLLNTASAKVISKIRTGKNSFEQGGRQITFGGKGGKADLRRPKAARAEPKLTTSKKFTKKILGMLTTSPKPQVISAVDYELKNPGDKEIPTAEVHYDDESNGTDEHLEESRRQEARESVMDAKHILMSLMEQLGKRLDKKANELFEAFRESKEYKEMLEVWWFSEQYPKSGDFRKFRMLGRGAFGVVSGVKHRYTGQLVAMKMMNKKLVKGKRALPLVHAEKEVLQILGDNPSSFTIWLKYAFQDSDYYYMAIPLCTGGDLSFHLSDSGTFSVERVRFYAAEIFEGLCHLHHLGIIYRDLKPENVILDSQGHCRISDMGLAAVTNGQRIKSKAGTPGYWAPEVLVKLFYSYAVDIWSLGVVIFEMLIGVCPFSRSNTGMDRDKATRYWPIKYPEFVGYRSDSKDERARFPDDLKSLLKGMLKRRASKRFTEEIIRGHPFFSRYNWEDLRNRRIPPPFVPAEKKINAGAAKYLEERTNEKEFKKVELTEQDNIQGFDYISKYAHEVDIVNVLNLRRDRPELMSLSSERRGSKAIGTKLTTKSAIARVMSSRVLGQSTNNGKKGDCVLM